MKKNKVDEPTIDIINTVLKEFEEMLQYHGKSLKDFSLPEPTFDNNRKACKNREYQDVAQTMVSSLSQWPVFVLFTSTKGISNARRFIWSAATFLRGLEV